MKLRFWIAISFLAIFTGLTSFSSLTDTNLVDDVLVQTNKFRRSNGLPELIMKDDLNSIAEKHSADMAKKRVAFGHDGFSQRESQARKKVKPMYRFAENVAYGVTTGKQVVTMWKNSPGHRRNMLGKYKYIGIGVAKDRQGRIFYTQVFAG